MIPPESSPLNNFRGAHKCLLFSSSYSFSRYEQPVCSRALDWSPQLCRGAVEAIRATNLNGRGIWVWPSPSIGHHRIEYRACFAQGRRCSCRSGRCLQGESPPLVALFGCHPWAQRQLSRNQVQSLSIGLQVPVDTAEPVSLDDFGLVPEPGKSRLCFSSRVKTA